MNFTDDEYKSICAEHQAICDVAGLQPFSVDTDTGFIFYLEAKDKDEDSNVQNISLIKAVVSKENAIYSKDEVLTALKKEMESTFPEYIIDTSESDPLKLIEIITLNEHRVANRVAQQTKRGFAMTKFLNFMFYKGKSPCDSAFIVYKFDDKYGIWKHPKAELYGFRLINK